jgi:glycine cleavage system H lipoate-binding protein
VGIDDFAGKLIGKPKGIRLPSPGKYLDLEEYCWTVNHEYDDLEFFSPLKGVVTSTNQELVEDTAMISDKPYSGGWLMTVEPDSINKSNRNFLTGNEARAWMIEEANLLAKGMGTEAGVTMHDGASIKGDLSSHLSKENWQKIVKNHLYIR